MYPVRSGVHAGEFVHGYCVTPCVGRHAPSGDCVMRSIQLCGVVFADCAKTNGDRETMGTAIRDTTSRVRGVSRVFLVTFSPPTGPVDGCREHVWLPFAF